MFKIITLLIIPFFIFACDKNNDEGILTIVQKFQQNEGKEFFQDNYNGKVDGFSYLKFIADTENNNVTMIERALSDRGVYDIKRREIFYCEENLCKTNTFNSEYESINISIDDEYTEVLLFRYQVGSDEDRLLTQQRYLSMEELLEEE